MNDELNVTTKLDTKQWSEFVSNHPKGNIFQTPEMYEVYNKTKKYEPVFLAVVDSNENVQALLLSHVIREFNGFIGSFSSRSIIQGGPLFVENDVGKEALKLLLIEYDKVANKKTLYTQIRNLYDTSKFKDVFLQNGYKYEGHLNFLIDLTKPKDELWATLTKNRRKGINRAERQGLIVEEIKDKSLLHIFYEILQETYKNAGIPLGDFSLFGSAFDKLTPSNKAKFYFAKNGNECIGARAILIYNDFIHDWYAGACGDSLELYPNEFLVWKILEWGCENGYKTFDFGGAGKSDEEYGPREFKRRFGGKLVKYGRYTKVYSPKKLCLAEKGFKIWKKTGGC
ncbi:MAG: peptidoglycan bridge formation glycyltransferase FemA/FemB family protein [Nanoarchaeota archaeon]|nr:peptidoglycan bridge formation glycyltransferase FemA/FemB family protein [Nanoarchaeota archaeon]